MILADELNKFVTLDRYELSNILANSGYLSVNLSSVKFLGLTNSSDFCYSVKYFDDTGERMTKVFVSKNATGKITAEF